MRKGKYTPSTTVRRQEVDGYRVAVCFE
jgi:hypothetical protein